VVILATGSLKVFVNIIPEWYLSVNYFHLCQIDKLYVEATIPFLLWYIKWRCSAAEQKQRMLMVVQQYL